MFAFTLFLEKEYIILEINALVEWKQVTSQYGLEVLIKPPEL